MMNSSLIRPVDSGNSSGPPAVRKRGSRKLGKQQQARPSKLSHQRGAVDKLAPNLGPSTGLSALSIARRYSSIGASPATGRQSPDGDAASGEFSK